MLGLDTVRTKDVRETHKLVVQHIASVRKMTNLGASTIVLCLESNLAYEAQHIIHMLQENGLKRWVALQEGAGGTLGWLTVRARCLFRALLSRLTATLISFLYTHRPTNGRRCAPLLCTRDL